MFFNTIREKKTHENFQIYSMGACSGKNPLILSGMQKKHVVVTHWKRFYRVHTGKYE